MNRQGGSFLVESTLRVSTKRVVSWPYGRTPPPRPGSPRPDAGPEDPGREVRKEGACPSDEEVTGRDVPKRPEESRGIRRNGVNVRQFLENSKLALYHPPSSVKREAGPAPVLSPLSLRGWGSGQDVTAEVQCSNTSAQNCPIKHGFTPLVGKELTFGKLRLFRGGTS